MEKNYMHQFKKFLEFKAYQMRVSSLLMTTAAGSGHPTSALSAADLVAALFFYAMRFDPKNYNNPNNDRFILSKGHAAPIFYAAFKELGIINPKDLFTYRKIDSNLEGHPTLRFEWTEAATGSLGTGLSIGAGMAYSAKMDHRNFKTFVLMGDSEIAEGSVWEATEIAAYYKLHNLIGILDNNRLGQSTEVMDNHHTHRYAEKFQAFGWKTFIIDGHDMQQVMSALEKAKDVKDQPSIIIAKTIKGYGIDSIEDKLGFHGKAFKKDEVEPLLQKLQIRFSAAANFDEKSFEWHPQLPENSSDAKSITCNKIELKPSNYKSDEKIATRKAYGQAITAAGVSCANVISLDAEVKNSTYADIFEEKFPDRFIQCFIAEQNMVSMGIGLNRRGKIPFISTFGCFFSRAYDQIRMAAISNSALRLCGSHAGVSIGEDGPSQMALEDIAMMRGLPESIVFYPSDAVSAYKLVEHMANYDRGISYLRTTRMDTPIIYDNNETFPIGGCKTLRQNSGDKALVIGAGITVHQALKAYDELAKENIFIAVIDLYSIKPLDVQTILKVAQNSSKKIITVEDHYIQGGIGQAVTCAVANTGITIECLAVTQLPRSGKPEELLAWAGIDSAAIIKKVKSVI
jgi:transketolase